MRHVVIIPLLLLLLLPLSAISQIKGRVLAKDSGEPLSGATILSSENNTTRSDFYGNFELTAGTFPLILVTSKSPFLNDTSEIKSNTEITIYLQLPVRTMDAVVVSAGRRAQKVEEVTVSMEILKPALINNKGITDLEQAVNQSPGVFAMDGQVSIRGGGGYAYGAGSRVLLLWNGIPMVSPDVGDVKWNAIPMENASQIEIIKGASSVLYGSGALNGVISMSEKDPSRKGELTAKIQSGIYDNPKRASLKWWSKNPTFHSADVYYGKMHKRVGYTFSMNGFTSDGYRKGEVEDRARFGGSLVFRPEKVPQLKAGLFYNAQYQYTGNFILWESDSLGYIAQGGMEPMAPGSTLSYQKSIRLNVDPYVKFTDKFKNKHELKTRYYLVSTGNMTELYASAKAELFYADYQFQHSLGKGNLILGATSNKGMIKSSVFNNHVSNSAAVYGQIERKFGKLDFSGGMRLEYFQQDTKTPDSEWRGLPFYPILRAGAHYQAWRATHLRVSFGQGIRFPSVAERYVATSSGGVIVFPNPELRAEKGYSAELGVKQVVKIGEWKAMFDAAAFINDYSNMIEFTFGLYNPPGFAPSLDWLGFRAENAEAARITGLELSFNSSGKIKEVEVISLVGYTYMNPISKNTNPEYIYGVTGIGGFSDTNSRMLKYRFNHLAKADIEVNYKFIACGVSMRYNSYMRNIDAVFMQDLDPTLNTMYILPGLKEYREKYNGGSLVFDARIGYKFEKNYRISLILNNILNSEYTSRPGDIQPPRTVIAQFSYQLQ
ncbi:MAG: TonB-dependent receptor [Flavobacteriia bacterium]